MSLKAAINLLVGDTGCQNGRESLSAPSANAIEGKYSCSLDDEIKQYQSTLNLEQNTCFLSCLVSFYPVAVDKHLTQRELDHTLSMYSYAVALSDDVQYDSSETYMNQTSVAILYNLAFMHHWRAVFLGISSGLLKALQMYELVARIIQPKDCGPEFENLTMAIWNNMGHVHSQLFQLKEARTCFDQLRLLLVQRDDILHWLPKKDYETFFLNAMFQGSELHLASAA
jgi:hypothetical protein